MPGIRPSGLTPADPALKALFGSPGPSLAFAGVLATLRRGHRSVCIGLVGDSTGDNRNGTGGPQVDEWPRVLVKRLGVDFPAYSVHEKQWNDAVQGYDSHLVHQIGTGGGGGERRAVFAKTTPGQLTYNGAAITGDIDIRVKVAPTAWTSAAAMTLAARWESTGSQRSWLLLLNPDGTLGLNWSTDGATAAGQKNSTAAATTVAAVIAGQPYWVRATLDVDNGATGNTLTFYTSPDGVTWTQLGTPVVTAAVTSIFGGTANYMIGSFTSGLTTPLDGSVYAVSIRAGLASQTSVVPPLPDDWDYGSAETTVSYAGAPVLMLLNGSQSGQNVAYFDNATRRPVIHQRHGQAVVMISTSHNDGTQQRQVWLANYNTMVNNIKTALPYVPILCLAQNQTGLGGAYAITAQGLELRAARGAILQQWAAAQSGVYSFDAWPIVSAADTIDQLHPATGPGSGSEKEGLALYDRIKAGA